MKRLVWLDIAKGLAILWVVYFHFFKPYRDWAPYPMSGHFIAEVSGEHGWDGLAASVETAAKIIWYAISGCGFHAVGLFIIVSGWSLASATARREAKAPLVWGAWYKARFIRLYPMYWLAHLVYLVSPFVARLEPIDYRFLISLTGLRMIDISMNFMYLNAAWWYFSMLIQLYLIFPVLYMAMRKLGLAFFLLLAFAVGFGTRYLLLEVWSANGAWILGGNALSRLPEFALGMVWECSSLPIRSASRNSFSAVRGSSSDWPSIWFAPYFYSGATPYVFADLWTGTCCFLSVAGGRGLAREMGAGGQMDCPGGSVFLRDLPGPSALRHLAGTSHPGPAGVGIFRALRDRPCRAQRLGPRPGEVRERHARKGYRRQEEARVRKTRQPRPANRQRGSPCWSRCRRRRVASLCLLDSVRSEASGHVRRADATPSGAQPDFAHPGRD
jgi:peptidoglycan/LPS O-acetylase OafA/YrhL